MCVCVFSCVYVCVHVFRCTLSLSLSDMSAMNIDPSCRLIIKAEGTFAF